MLKIWESLDNHVDELVNKIEKITLDYLSSTAKSKFSSKQAERNFNIRQSAKFLRFLWKLFIYNSKEVQGYKWTFNFCAVYHVLVQFRHFRQKKMCTYVSYLSMLQLMFFVLIKETNYFSDGSFAQ